MKSKYIILSIIALAFVNFSFTWLSPKNNPSNNLIERVYIQTDKPLYFPGETVYFKAYIVLNNNQVTNISDVVYFDLISPKGDRIKTVKARIGEGSAYGSFDISTEMTGGMYSVQGYTQWMKNFGVSIVFNRKIMVQKVVKPNLLLKLDFQKEAYGKNSEVIANFEAKDLKDKALSDKKIKFQVNIAGEKVISESFLTNNEGKAEIKFNLPQDLATSDVLLNIRVEQNGTMEAISRTVPVILDNLDLQFMPEGGYLLSGVKNTLAFKALNEWGKPADFTAEIIDEQGKTLQLIESFHEGMGACEFLPEKGKKYFARIIKPFKSELLYEIPQARNEGYLLSVVKNDSLDIVLNIFSAKAEQMILRVKNTNELFIQEKLKLNKGWNEISLSAEEFPIGILEFTLLNKFEIPQVERLLFANKDKELKISVKTDKKKYSPREKVKVKITTTDKYGKATPSNLSIAVADNKILSLADDKQDNILSYLLVSSYLKGKIEKPNFYFDPKEAKATKALDMVMLTHGWREYFFDKNDSTREFVAEQIGIESRTVTNLDNQPVKATVLILEQNSGRKLVKLQTDSTGTFAFKKEANKNYVAIAYNNKNEQLKIHKGFIYAKKTSPDNSAVPTKIEAPNKTNKTDYKEYNINNNKIKRDFHIRTRPIKNRNVSLSTGASRSESAELDLITLDKSEVALDECIVVGYGSVRKSNLVATVVSISRDELVIPNIAYALAGRIAGLEVTESNSAPGASTEIRIRGYGSVSGNSQALIIIDGVPVSTSYNSEVFKSLSMDNIASVNVLKGAAASAIYGSKAANGVIVITSKTGTSLTNGKFINFKKAKNYALDYSYSYSRRQFTQTKQFYMPIYEDNEPVTTRNDFRNTIYWNPVIQTDENGEANFFFYNSDDITSFKITAEGIAYNGLPGRVEQTYNIQKPLSIDVKIPAYLTVGDTLKIPLIVSNNTDSEIHSSIALNLPTEIQLISKFPKEISISAQSGETFNLKIVSVKEITKTTILLGVKSSQFEDMFTQEATILSPLFPKRLSFSNSKSHEFNFNLNKRIEPNSLKANFTIYMDIIGDVMNGIESIMREPYGCFEQVSASTYPNVLAMKYLRESGKLTHQIEKKALAFIKNGYTKLAAYETSQGGFEWYGDTPPHEVLSAYGVMQFTDMKEVYAKVDNKMIARTVDWILSRRDGEGGFKQNNGRYGFSGAPQNVNNAYIVYALAESGIEMDIEKEYQSTLKEALESKDIYRLSLLASASFELGEMENYQNLIDLIIRKVNWDNLENIEVENSITRSYGNSLSVESCGFIALAMMKTNNYKSYIEKCIDFILNNRKYGRFGNTQATTMALKALIKYTRLRKMDYINKNENSVSIIINGNKEKARLVQESNGLIQISGLEKYINQGNQKIEVKFSNSEISVPYAIDLSWKTRLPELSDWCPINFNTLLSQKKVGLGKTVRLNISVENKRNFGLPMTIAIVGIPSGLSVQSWQLEELKEKNQFAYYELKQNYVVFYWRELGPKEIRELKLDLKTEVKGRYTAPASSAYLYYSDENKNWIKGSEIEIY